MSQATMPAAAKKSVEKLLKELREQPENFELITRKEAVSKILALRDKNSPEMFSVLFIRRQNKPGFPPERLMLSSFNIEKFEVGGPPKYNPADFNLFWVADMELVADGNQQPYRSINAETILEVKIKGVRYKVIQEGVGLKSDKR